MTDIQTVHKPVLLQEVLDNLLPTKGDVVLDATLGGGGHALELANAIGESGTLIGFDADSVAISRVESVLRGVSCSVNLINRNFKYIKETLDELGINGIDIALFDLGFSSDQIELSGRGFSFNRDEPLDMRLADNNENAITQFNAYDIVNTWEEDNIADIIYWYGQEHYARKIAKAIVENRKVEPIATTKQLADIINKVIRRRGKTNPATKTFQALRIAVNDELDVIKNALDVVIELLNPGGRIGVITFHSLEDRIIKNKFKEWKKQGVGEILTKKPIIPTREEILKNKRARSSKLRVFKKMINNK